MEAESRHLQEYIDKQDAYLKSLKEQEAQQTTSIAESQQKFKSLLDEFKNFELETQDYETMINNEVANEGDQVCLMGNLEEAKAERARLAEMFQDIDAQLSELDHLLALTKQEGTSSAMD